VYSVLFTLCCALYTTTMYYILSTVHYILYTLYYILCTVYSALCTIYCILCTVYCILCTVYSVLYTLYFVDDQRVGPLVVFVKRWAKFHNINSAKDKTISSYVFTLMVIHYLQMGVPGPPVLPALQHTHPVSCSHSVSYTLSKLYLYNEFCTFSDLYSSRYFDEPSKFTYVIHEKPHMSF